MITSTSNQRIKEIVQLQKKNRARNTEGVFIVEGIRMVREIPEDKLKALYVTEEFYKKHKAELPGNVKPEFVTPTVFSYIADTKTPQGVLAIVWQNKYTLADILEKGTEKKEMLLVLDNLQDPGNLGTIFRTAEAAGVTGIILSKDSVDIYNPKVIRSTAGSLFHLPILAMGTDDFFAWCDTHELAVYAADVYGTDSRQPESLTDVIAAPETLAGAKAVLFGNEARGLTKEVLERTDRIVSIPLYGKAESLNLGTSSAVMLLSLAMSSHVERL